MPNPAVFYPALRTLIETHPTHGSTSDADMVVWLTDPTGVTRARATMPTTEMRDVIFSENAEYALMTDAERDALSLIFSSGDEIPIENGTPVRETLEAILGTNTKLELGNRQNEQVARWVDAGLEKEPNEDHVAHARTYGD